MLTLAILIINIAIFAAVIVYFRIKIRFVASQIHNSRAELATLVWEADDIKRLAPSAFLPRPGPWSLRGDALRIIMKIIEERRPKLVVELGSGLSTIVVANRLRDIGGRLVSIDHDSNFGDQTRGFIKLNQLDDVIELRLAYLTNSDLKSAPPWYDETVLCDLVDVDLLIVDGPPAPIHDRIRQHALDFFFSRLSRNGLMFFDDADRVGERKFLDEWLQNQPAASAEYIALQKGAMIVRRGLQ